MQVGDPLDPATEIGPMVAQRQQERVEKYIALGQEEGARVVLGGNGMPDGLSSGWYVRPTIFAGVNNGMRIAQEEIFGPVLSVIPFDDVDDAVRIANDSEYGLAGTVWTGDVEAGLDVARQVRAGTYGVNTYTMDFSAPVRRLQELRHRARVRSRGPGAVHRAEVHLQALTAAVSGVAGSAGACRGGTLGRARPAGAPPAGPASRPLRRCRRGPGRGRAPRRTGRSPCWSGRSRSPA